MIDYLAKIAAPVVRSSAFGHCAGETRQIVIVNMYGCLERTLLKDMAGHHAFFSYRNLHQCYFFEAPPL
jgi:hypothetical protein